MGFLKAAKTFGVPKTTLIRLSQNNAPLNEITNLKLGRKATLPKVLEADLTKYILQMEQSGFGLTRCDIIIKGSHNFNTILPTESRNKIALK